MSLFGFKKKAENKACCDDKQVKKTCNCEGKYGNGDAKSSRFVVLGACCKRSLDTFANIKQAVAELGLTDEVLNIEDAVEIAKYGVMQTPALIIDGKVVSYGRLIQVNEAKKLIKNAVE